MHSKLKGNIAESVVASELMKVGCKVFREMGDLSRIDLIADINQKLLRIQCKGATAKDGKIILNFRKSGPNYKFVYDKNDVDFFALCDLGTFRVALIPSSILNENCNCLTLRVTQCKNRQKKGSKDFEDFSIQKMICNN